MIRSGIDMVHNKRLKSHLDNEAFLSKVFNFSELRNRKKTALLRK